MIIIMKQILKETITFIMILILVELNLWEKKLYIAIVINQYGE